MSTQTNKFKRAARIAKKLYKTGRYKMYSDAMKAAFNKISRQPGKKRTVAKLKTAKRRKLKRAAPKKNIASVLPGTLSGAISVAKKIIENRIAFCELAKFKATTKAAKRRYQKKISDYKKQYNKL